MPKDADSEEEKSVLVSWRKETVSAIEQVSGRKRSLQQSSKQLLWAQSCVGSRHLEKVDDSHKTPTKKPLNFIAVTASSSTTSSVAGEAPTTGEDDEQ